MKKYRGEKEKERKKDYVKRIGKERKKRRGFFCKTRCGVRGEELGGGRWNPLSPEHRTGFSLALTVCNVTLWTRRRAALLSGVDQNL